MRDELASRLTRLPEPTPPVSLQATVMARIARDADDGPAVRRSRVAATRALRDRLVWVSVLAGLAVVLCGSAYGWLVDGKWLDLTSPRIGPGGPSLTTLTGPAGLLLGLGLLIFVAGLLAPLRDDRRKA